MQINHYFRKFSRRAAEVVGSPWTFVLAILVIVVWAICGPRFQYNDTWQLIINTGTTVVTFLMVFLIQNTQNRDTMAIQIKLDELIRSVKHARNSLIDLDCLSDEELQQVHADFQTLCDRHKLELESRKQRPKKPSLN